jgi:hypothetical protein
LSRENAKKVARFWPHLHHTGGFFIAKFQKKITEDFSRITEDYRKITKEKNPKSPEGATHPRIGHRPINKGHRPINKETHPKTGHRPINWEYSGELQKKVRAYVKEQGGLVHSIGKDEEQGVVFVQTKFTIWMVATGAISFLDKLFVEQVGLPIIKILNDGTRKPLPGMKKVLLFGL